jgi:hypothetical protein
MARIDGGEGHDSAVIRAGRRPITVLGPDGEVLFQRGRGGTVVRVNNVEELRVLGAKGKTLFASNQASDC